MEMDKSDRHVSDDLKGRIGRAIRYSSQIMEGFVRYGQVVWNESEAIGTNTEREKNSGRERQVVSCPNNGW